MAARLEEDSGTVKVSWNLAATASSGVAGNVSAGFRVHLLSSTRLACFSGWGSRNADFAVSRTLRLGTQQLSGTLETWARGVVWRSGSSSGKRRESANDKAAGGVDVAPASCMGALTEPTPGADRWQRRSSSRCWTMRRVRGGSASQAGPEKAHGRIPLGQKGSSRTPPLANGRGRRIYPARCRRPPSYLAHHELPGLQGGPRSKAQRRFGPW